MKFMFNSSALPHSDYCSELWMPQEGQHLVKLEKLLRDFTQLLGKIEQHEHELRTETTGEVSNHVHLENHGGFGPKLWTYLDQ